MHDLLDPLADVLRSVRLTGGIFVDARFTAPWCVSGCIRAEDCSTLLPPGSAGPVHIIACHIVLAGKLVAAVEGEPAIEVSAGEIVLIPRDEVNQLASATALKPVNARKLVRPAADGGLPRISYGGGGEVTRLVCGFLATDSVHNPLIATLPRLFKIDVRECARDWIDATIRFAIGELKDGRLASSGLISHLSELLFVQAVRRYVTTLSGEAAGWLKGLKDPQIGAALALIHQNIGASWSIEMLAREVA